MKIFFAIGFMACFSFLISSCSPRITTQKYPVNIVAHSQSENVRVYELDENIPHDAETVGKIKIDDGGFSAKCSYQNVISLALNEARKLRGNAIKITSHKKPDLWSTCHRIEALVLSVPSDTDNQEEQDSISPALVKQLAGSLHDPVFRKEVPDFRFAVNGGWSYLTAKKAPHLSSATSKHVDDLRNGLDLGADATYYFSENMGFGLMYSFRRHGAKNLFEMNDGFKTIDDEYTLHYVAPTFNMRAIAGAKNNHHFLFGVGIGYMAYRNKIETYNILGTANMVATSLGIGYDCLLSKSFAVGIQIQYITGQFKKIKWTDKSTGISQFQFIDNDDWESVSRIGISLGLRLLK